MHTDTVVCRVCLSSCRLFLHVVCKLPTTPTVHTLCSFFCLSVCFVHSWHFMEDIILQPVCQSAEKAVFFMCWSETGCLNAISKFTDVSFPFLVSSYLTLQNSVCLLSSYICVRLWNSTPAALIGRATGPRDLCRVCWCCVDAFCQ